MSLTGCNLLNVHFLYKICLYPAVTYLMYILLIMYLCGNRRDVLAEEDVSHLYRKLEGNETEIREWFEDVVMGVHCSAKVQRCR